jgi:hypothetical protein
MFPDPTGWPPKYNTDAPLSKWKKNCAYDTVEQCFADKQDAVHNIFQAGERNSDPEMTMNFYLAAEAYDSAIECVASDDPRLKGK